MPGKGGQIARERGTACPTRDVVIRRNEVDVGLDVGQGAEPRRAGHHTGWEAGGLGVGTEVAPERGVRGARGTDGIADGGTAQHRVGRRLTKVDRGRRRGDSCRNGRPEACDEQAACECSEAKSLRPTSAWGVTLEPAPNGPDQVETTRRRRLQTEH